MFLPYSIVNPLMRIEVVRSLSLPGQIIVHENEVVEPLQIVAEMTAPPAFRIINVARKLGVSPQKAKRYLTVKVGAALSKGDVMASRGGWGGHVCQAPFDGTVTGYGRGRFLFEAQPRRVQLSALVPGRVARVWPDEQLVIQTQGAFIQGAWGNGKENYGVIKLVVRSARHALRAKRLDASAQGAIVVGGTGLDEEALEQALEMRVGGIIVGGVPVNLLPRLHEVDFPVLATEGVGKIPMSAAVFKLLHSLDGREAAVSGQLRTGRESVRPYIVIPMPSDTGAQVHPETPLEVGSRVRALRQPYLGMSGTVVNLPQGPRSLKTGARLPGAEVDFDGETIFLPFANLELLL
ncbi:MAG: hypothetical protein DRI37_00790 [Chloroflexi bacterium]|nr:MAG: hypothetical protein DRI37_00790 [Chloroflexota bacterium]